MTHKITCIIIGAKFHILNHEEKGNVSIRNLWLVCGITIDMYMMKFVPVSYHL